MPSVSTSIGDFYPQLIIWRLCISLHAFPRYFISAIHYKTYFMSRQNTIIKKNQFKLLIKISFIFNYIEITSLLLLTHVSSKDNHFLHAAFFATFIASSTIFMGLISLSYFFKQIESKEPKTKNLRLFILSIYIISLIIGFYFFFRHRKHCEPYMFSLFSLFEYIIVLTNILFHSLVLQDLNLFKNFYKIKMVHVKND